MIIKLIHKLVKTEFVDLIEYGTGKHWKISLDILLHHRIIIN